MSHKPRYALIGSFVVGACAIVVIALLYFGSGKAFKQTRTVVSYFSGSVKGLSVGAPVNFRGAKIGNVTDIKVTYLQENDTLLIPVFYDIEADAIQGLRTRAPEIADQAGAPLLQRLISRGLKAQLAMESLVTGQLYVQLDFFPEAASTFRAPSPQNPEIPSVPSSFEKISETLQQLPLQDIASTAQRLLESVDSYLASEDSKQIPNSLRALLADSDLLVRNLDQNGTHLVRQGDDALADFKRSLARANATLDALRAISEPSHPLMRKTILALDDIAAAARAVKRFAEYAEQHPEAFMRGKR
jgi:paraquat-inducible protein B